MSLEQGTANRGLSRGRRSKAGSGRVQWGGRSLGLRFRGVAQQTVRTEAPRP